MNQKILVFVLLLLPLLEACDGSGSDAPVFSVFPAPRQADVIIAIDSSASMDDEVGFVQDQINAFAATLLGDGIDLRIIVIVDSPLFCVPAPLGSGSCPADENLPGYRHQASAVGSNDAFDVILATHPNWSSSLRGNATRTIIVVSDDDSTTTATSFDTQLLALDASFTGYRFNAFAATLFNPAVATDPCFGLSAAVGSEYIGHVTTTRGVLSDLCDQDFNTGFSDMAAIIIGDLPL